MRCSLFKLVIDEILDRFLRLIRQRAQKTPLFCGMVVPVDDLIGRRIMATGMFEATQIEGVCNLSSQLPDSLGRHGLFIDVGANIGVFTMALAPHFGSCLAVEANPQTFKVLEANIALKGLENVTPVCVGASDHAGDAVVHIPLNGNLGWGSLHEDQNAGPVKKIAIRTQTLDRIYRDASHRPVGLIKIDVEGHEFQVLQGAVETIRVHRPAILFEVLHDAAGRDIIEFLRGMGYTRFCRFRRAIPTWRDPVGLLTSFFRNLPVDMVATDPAASSQAALVCAIAD